MRKSFLNFILCIALAVSTLLIGCAKEETGDDEQAGGVSYPQKAIEFVVPASAGGATDLSARILAKHLQKKLGKPVIVENVVGSGGVSGSKLVYDADPDGYKILYFHNSLILNKISGLSDYSYDGFKVGPAVAIDSTAGFFVNAQSDIKDINGLIEIAKENPGEIKAGTEYGAYTYFMLIKFQNENGIKLKLIDVGSATDKRIALLAGEVDLIPTVWGGSKSFVETGDFRVLGIPAEERADNAANVPTYKEQGVDFTYPAFQYGTFFPKETPEEVIEIFDRVVKEIVESDEFKKDIEKVGVVSTYTAPAVAEKKLKELTKLYTDIFELKDGIGK